MKIVKIEDMHCDAGWRDFSFLKITTDDGIVGWSEYNEGYGSAGITERPAESATGAHKHLSGVTGDGSIR